MVLLKGLSILSEIGASGYRIMSLGLLNRMIDHDFSLLSHQCHARKLFCCND